MSACSKALKSWPDGLSESPKPRRSNVSRRYFGASAPAIGAQSHEEVGKPWIIVIHGPSPSTRTKIEYRAPFGSWTSTRSPTDHHCSMPPTSPGAAGGAGGLLWTASSGGDAQRSAPSGGPPPPGQVARARDGKF